MRGGLGAIFGLLLWCFRGLFVGVILGVVLGVVSGVILALYFWAWFWGRIWVCVGVVLGVYFYYPASAPYGVIAAPRVDLRMRARSHLPLLPAQRRAKPVAAKPFTFFIRPDKHPRVGFLLSVGAGPQRSQVGRFIRRFIGGRLGPGNRLA